jgi:predicted RNA-binding Zn-ribbon protein involved in translation (DUF1610 family)
MPKLQHVSECYTCGLEFVTQREVEEEWRCPDCEAKPKLRFHYSLEHANKVLKIVQDMIEQEAPRDFEGSIGAWSNCREQGYYLAVDDDSYGGDFGERPALVVAQVRNSDGVLVVAGNTKDFDTHHMPSDRLWEIHGCGYRREAKGPGRHSFASDHKAARFIVDHLLRKE